MNEPTNTYEMRNPYGPEPVYVDVYPLAWGTVRAVVRGTNVEHEGSFTDAHLWAWLKWASGAS